MTERTVKIGRRSIGGGNPVFIIAEAGVNHNGSLALAIKLIDAAKASGADAVKFQTFKTEALVTSTAPKAAYQKRNSAGGRQFEMLKRLELSDRDFAVLFEHCRKQKIVFLSTPFDAASANFLLHLGTPAFKISSGDLTNQPFLSMIARYRKPVILSSGMSDLAEVKDAVKTVRSAGNQNLVLMHCTSNYPARFEDVNLKAMLTLKKEFGLPTGYSDHTLGREVAAAAVALGACVIEKHFTLDKKLPGPDHAASLEPGELAALVRAIRNVEKALGSGIKRPQPSELPIQRIARKSLVAARDILKGERLTEEMLAVKRPGTGIAPSYFLAVMGKRAAADIKADEILKWAKIS